MKRDKQIVFVTGNHYTAKWPGAKAVERAALRLKHGKWKTYPNDNDAVLEQVKVRFPGGVF